MHYQTYLRFRQIKEKLTQHFIKKEKEINQPIFIRDIHVYTTQKNHATGEANKHKNKHAKREKPLTRLIDHIQLLAHTANHYHEHYNCEKAGNDTRIKPDCLNKITRISLNEFSLYPHVPFAEATFSLLLAEVEKIARQQQDNVHLVLSSIPVVTRKGELLNLCLYVQCGSTPKIETFTKSNPSKVDISYSRKLFAQKQRGSDCPAHFVASIANSTSTVSCNTVFIVKTKGGASYVQAVDICYDHFHVHSKKLAVYTIRADGANNTAITPAQANDLLTSHVISPIPTSTISDSQTHIDQRYGRPGIRQMKNDTVTADDLMAAHIKKRYPDCKVKKRKNGFVFKRPPFGSNIEVIAGEEKKIGHFSNGLGPLVQHHNKKVLEHQIELQFKANTPKKAYKEFAAIAAYSKVTVRQLDTFYNELLHQCDSGLVDTLFNTQNYIIRQQAQTLVKAAYQTFKKLIRLDSDSVPLLLNVSESLLDLKLKLEHLDFAICPPLIADLIQCADAKAQELKRDCGARITFN